MGVLYERFCTFDDDEDMNTPDCMIMGDFNMGDGDEGESLAIREYDFRPIYICIYS
jgi:hypothetical protein